MAVKSMILKDLRLFTCSNLSIVDSTTYDFGCEVACKSVILMDLKSFRIILLREAARDQRKRGKLATVLAIVRSFALLRMEGRRFHRGDDSHFGNSIRMESRSLQ